MNRIATILASLTLAATPVVISSPAHATIGCAGTTPTRSQSSTYAWTGSAWTPPGYAVRPAVAAADVKVTLKYQDCNGNGNKIRPTQITVKWLNTNPVGVTAAFMQDELFDTNVGFGVYNGDYPAISGGLVVLDYLGAADRTWVSGDLSGFGWVLVSDGPYVAGWWTIRDYDPGHPGDLADPNVTYQWGGDGFVDIHPGSAKASMRTRTGPVTR